MRSLDVIWVWKASQVAFGCSIRYSGAFLFNPVGLSPLTVNSMYLAFLWFCWLSLSALVPLGSSGHPLSRLHFWLCDKSFGLALRCLVHNSLLWFCVCICLGHLKTCRWRRLWSGPKLLHRLLSLHTILLLVLEEVKKIVLSFWIDFALFRRCQLVLIQVGSWFCFRQWVEMTLIFGQGRCLRICLEPSQGLILCSLPSSVVSGFVGFCLPTDYFISLKWSRRLKFSINSWGLSYWKFSRLTLLWKMIKSASEVSCLGYQSCRFNRVARCLTLVRRLVLVAPVSEVVSLIVWSR